MTQTGQTISQVIDNLRRVFQAVGEFSRNAEAATGLTGPQLWAVKLLANSSPLKVSELARQMFLHPATMVGILDRLEGKGLVSRTRSTEDRRVVEIELTEQGKDVVFKAPEVAQLMLLKGLAALPEDVFCKAAEGMEIMVHLLGAENLTPQPLLSTDESRTSLG